MKHASLIFSLILFALTSIAQENIRPSCRNHKAHIHAQKPSPEQLRLMESMAFRSDTFDIVHYAIHLEDVNYSLRSIKGFCDIHFSPKMEGQNQIHFDLLNLPVDSVTQNGQHLSYIYDDLMLHIQFDQDLSVNDTSIVRVFYGGQPTIDASGFGGFDFQDGYSYNLGIGLASIPHNYGRGWFPCFDNFVERSTYEFFVTTLNTQFAYCVGTHVATEDILPGKKRFIYSMEQEITTYQAAVAVADYALTRSFHEGLEKEIPVELVAKAQDTTKFKNSFAFLIEAIEALEQWYGPFKWERVGYVITTRGAMEHPTCVAYPASLGLNENPYNNMDIMSHELAHHWFGNLTTLTTALDMWIKEGTSEYGYHLFSKEFLGDDEFYDLIADNQFDVIENAHKADDGFRALSGMPMEYTYGMTTYQKGAAVIHNMHSYLGDSLFKVGVRAILDKYAFSHCDAAEFENTLSESTGMDMSNFFDAWIYAPGFSAFEIDSVVVNESGNLYDVELYIEQKLFNAPDFHKQVPMEVTFFDNHWNKHVEHMMLDGQYSQVNISLDFEPVFQLLNNNNFLNNGQLSSTIKIKETDKYKFKRSKLDVEVKTINDSILLVVEHMWGAPDPFKQEDLEIDLSNTHYWIIEGINPSNSLMTTKLYYDGSNEKELDYDLSGESEEDIILLYRRDASADWIEYPYAFKNSFIPSDGKGFFGVDSLLFGQYCFANGDFGVSNEAVILEDQSITFLPNPARSNVEVDLGNLHGKYSWHLIDISGSTVAIGKVPGSLFNLDVSNVPAGSYFLGIYNENNELVLSGKLLKVK